jgi:hypothetical protein
MSSSSSSWTFAAVLPAPVTLLHALVLHLLRHHARPTRHDASDLTPTLPYPFAARSTVATMHLPAPPRPPREPIKGARPSTHSAHQSLPLSLLSLLDHLPLHIFAGATSISRQSLWNSRRRSRRLEPPQATPPVPGASPSSTTSLHPLADDRRPPVSPPTP